jgi:hypothetical protein
VFFVQVRSKFAVFSSVPETGERKLSVALMLTLG